LPWNIGQSVVPTFSGKGIGSGPGEATTGWDKAAAAFGASAVETGGFVCAIRALTMDHAANAKPVQQIFAIAKRFSSSP
jgi:hypothetical protein